MVGLLLSLALHRQSSIFNQVTLQAVCFLQQSAEGCTVRCATHREAAVKSTGSVCTASQRPGGPAADLVDALALDGAAMPLPLQGQGGDQALDLGRLAVLLAVLLLHRPVGVDVLADVVVLGQVEQLADLGRALGAAHARFLCVCQPGDLASTCAHVSESLPAHAGIEPGVQHHRRYIFSCIAGAEQITTGQASPAAVHGMPKEHRHCANCHAASSSVEKERTLLHDGEVEH